MTLNILYDYEVHQILSTVLYTLVWYKTFYTFEFNKVSLISSPKCGNDTKIRHESCLFHDCFKEMYKLTIIRWIERNMQITKQPDLFCKPIFEHLDTLFHSQKTLKSFCKKCE